MVTGGFGNSTNRSDVYLVSVYMYDADAGTWSGPKAEMPEARGFFGIVHIPSVDGIGRGHVMVAGGNNNDEQYLDCVYMYDADAGTWSGPKAKMPVVRREFGMVHIPSVDGIGRGHVMVAGGKGDVTDANDVTLDSVYMYDVDAGTWSGPATAMPDARQGFGMVYIPSRDGIGRGHVMVAGGNIVPNPNLPPEPPNPNGGYLDSVYMYDVDAGTWSGPATAMSDVR